MIGCLISSNTESSSAKPRAWISGPPTTLPVTESTTTTTEMKPSSPRIRRSLSVGLGDVADRRSRRRRRSRSRPCRRPSPTPSTRSTTTPSSASTTRSAAPRSGAASAALARRCRISPCTGMHVARLDDVVAVEQLTGGGVAGDVHQRVALVHDVGAPAGQPVDHPVDRVLVAGDQRGRQHDGVARARCARVWSRWAIRDSADIGSPCEPVEISTICSWRQVVELLGVDEHARRGC